jgi:hypothetical protein
MRSKFWNSIGLNNEHNLDFVAVLEPIYGNFRPFTRKIMRLAGFSLDLNPTLWLVKLHASLHMAFGFHEVHWLRF